MRTGSATYIRRGAALALAAIALAGCGSAPKDERVSGGTLTVYESLPLHGSYARVADATAAGARLALSDAHGRAGGLRVRLVELDSSDPSGGGATWDPSAVEANAKRAANDPTTIAYLGELDQGGSAISVPVTNDKGILQVSPFDGLTSLTRVDPAGPAATGPERYYPSGRRTFLRLVPTDLLQAEVLVDWARAQGARSIAFVQDEQLFGRELASQAAVAARGAGITVTDDQEARDDPTAYPDLALKLAEKRPDALLYTGVGDPRSGPLLAALRRAMPNALLLASSAMSTAAPTPSGLPPVELLDPALPASDYPPAGAAGAGPARAPARRAAPGRGALRLRGDAGRARRRRRRGQGLRRPQRGHAGGPAPARTPVGAGRLPDPGRGGRGAWALRRISPRRRLSRLPRHPQPLARSRGRVIAPLPTAKGRIRPGPQCKEEGNS